MPDRDTTISSDGELIARVATGDRDAFAALYDRFASKLFGLILHFLKIHDDGEEVLQEVFLQIWAQANRFDATRSTVEGWVTMIARSRALDRIRKRQDAAQLAFDLPALDLDVNPGLEMERSDEARRLMLGLASLPSEQNEAIQLAFYGGLTHDQISQKLGIPLGTVKTRIRLGMIRLRDYLGLAKENDNS